MGICVTTSEPPLLGRWVVLKVFALLRAAAPNVVASTVSIPAVLVLHTDMEPFLEAEGGHCVRG